MINWKNIIVKYAITIVVCGLVTMYYCFSQEILLQTKADQFKILADGFTIPGVLLTSFGLLCWASTKGALDGVAFGVRTALKMLIPGGMLRAQQDFGDFVEERRANRITGYEFIIVVGVVFVAIALVFVWLFYKAL